MNLDVMLVSYNNVMKRLIRIHLFAEWSAQCLCLASIQLLPINGNVSYLSSFKGASKSPDSEDQIALDVISVVHRHESHWMISP